MTALAAIIICQINEKEFKGRTKEWIKRTSERSSLWNEQNKMAYWGSCV